MMPPFSEQDDTVADGTIRPPPPAQLSPLWSPTYTGAIALELHGGHCDTCPAVMLRGGDDNYQKES